jgi:hypothetical protein
MFTIRFSFIVAQFYRAARRAWNPQAPISLLPHSRWDSTSSVNINITHTCSPTLNTFEILTPLLVHEHCRTWNNTSVAPSIHTTMPSLNDLKGSEATDPATEQKKPSIDFAALAREREQRRLQMSNKRDRSISPPPTQRDTRKAPKLDSTTVSLPSGARLTSFSAVVQDDQRTRKSTFAQAATEKLMASSSAAVANGPSHTPAAPPQPAKAKPGDVQYPRGVVKKTWAFGHERTGNDIKLEEVLESQTLRTAVLSAFQWDIEWLFRKIKIDQTKCIFVMQAKEQSMKDQMLEETKDMRKFLRLCFPSMAGLINCMHSKLMLLFHPDKLRVAIPTANLLDFDWGENGVMENSVWLIDLPRLPSKATTVDDLTNFGKELMYFIQKQGLPEDAIEGILNFDFSATKDIAFVHTVGGMLYDEEAGRTGLPGLAQAVRQTNQTTTDLEIDFAASSMGSLKDEFLRNVHAAASGRNMLERAEASTAQAKSSFFQAKKPTSDDHSIRDKVRLYFPTHETAISSKSGGTGTICINRKWFEDMTFPRRCFRDYISTRPGLLSHNKILYARGVRKTDEDDDQPAVTQKVAWAYVGSANMSESAWGKLVYDRKEKKWKLNCKNWECGVLLPASTEGASTEAGKNGVVNMEVFKDVVEPPFMYPGIEYEDREPWYFQEKH